LRAAQKFGARIDKCVGILAECDLSESQKPVIRLPCEESGLGITDATSATAVAPDWSAFSASWLGSHANLRKRDINLRMDVVPGLSEAVDLVGKTLSAPSLDIIEKWSVS